MAIVHGAFVGLWILRDAQLPRISVSLPFSVGLTCSHICKGLFCYISLVGFLPRKTSTFLPRAKDNSGLKTVGVYSISCVIWQGRQDVQLTLVSMSTIRLSASQSWQGTSTWNITSRSKTPASPTTNPKTIMEAIETIETKLHPSNMNRENGFSLNKSWKPLFYPLNEYRKPSS